MLVEWPCVCGSCRHLTINPLARCCYRPIGARITTKLTSDERWVRRIETTDAGLKSHYTSLSKQQHGRRMLLPRLSAFKQCSSTSTAVCTPRMYAESSRTSDGCSGASSVTSETVSSWAVNPRQCRLSVQGQRGIVGCAMHICCSRPVQRRCRFDLCSRNKYCASYHRAHTAIHRARLLTSSTNTH